MFLNFIISGDSLVISNNTNHISLPTIDLIYKTTSDFENIYFNLFDRIHNHLNYHSILIIIWTPLYVSTIPLIYPTFRLNAASSNGFCI
jgi:hypothetical protein